MFVELDLSRGRPSGRGREDPGGRFGENRLRTGARLEVRAPPDHGRRAGPIPVPGPPLPPPPGDSAPRAGSQERLREPREPAQQGLSPRGVVSPFKPRGRSHALRGHPPRASPVCVSVCQVGIPAPSRPCSGAAVTSALILFYFFASGHAVPGSVGVFPSVNVLSGVFFPKLTFPIQGFLFLGIRRWREGAAWGAGRDQTGPAGVLTSGAGWSGRSGRFCEKGRGQAGGHGAVPRGCWLRARRHRTGASGDPPTGPPLPCGGTAGGFPSAERGWGSL